MRPAGAAPARRERIVLGLGAAILRARHARVSITRDPVALARAIAGLDELDLLRDVVFATNHVDCELNPPLFRAGADAAALYAQALAWTRAAIESRWPGHPLLVPGDPT